MKLNCCKICLFFIIAFLFICECSAEYNLATKRQEHIFFSTESEVKLGRSIAEKVEAKYKVCKDAQIRERVEQIGQKIISVCERKDISYSFTVLEEEKANAFALPGGYIYINKGAIEETDSDDEIAGILAHELGHIVARHSIKRLQASLGYNILSILALAATKDARFKRGADFAFAQIMLGYSREDELLADELAVRYLRESGYNPEGIVSFLEKLKQIEKEAPRKALIPTYARTHPYLPERIGAVKLQIYGKMDFNDYLNKGE